MSTTKPKKTESEKIKEFLETNRDLLNINQLETKIGASRSTINKFVNGTRELPAKHLPKLKEALEPLGLSL